MSLNDFLKKFKLKNELSNLKLSNEQIDEIYNLYNYVINLFLEKYSNELKKNKDITRVRIKKSLMDDISKIIYMKKGFIINYITLEYVFNKKNSFTISQFLKNFHYLSQNINENDNFYYNISVFIQYVMNRAYDDKNYLECVLTDKSLSKIANDYFRNVKLFFGIPDTEEIINMYNYLVGIIWYNELLRDYPDILSDISMYLIDHYDEIKEAIENDNSFSDTSYNDNLEAIIDNYKNNKVKKLS